MTGTEFKAYVSGEIAYEHDYRTLIDQQISKPILSAGINNYFNTNGYGSRIWYIDIDAQT